MDVNWLDDALVLLEEGSLSRAAARRNITQPAFSRRIRSFENWLGVTVLARRTNSIDISPALVSNEAEIRALVARIRELRTRIAHFDPASSVISIAAQHAPVFSMFPDMALLSKRSLPQLKFRMRAGNLRDCVTMFMRGDASVLLCYESENTGPLPFSDSVRRALWGVDYLVPLVGGPLRYTVKDNSDIQADTPAVVYPENSYLGEVLNRAQRSFGTQGYSLNPICETAFSSGIKELLLKGMGVGWLPYSMAHREIESGELVSLAACFGREPLEVAIYGDTTNETAVTLLEIWASKMRKISGLP